MASMPLAWKMCVTALQFGLNWSMIEDPATPPAGLGAARAATWGAGPLSAPTVGGKWVVSSKSRRLLNITRRAVVVAVAFVAFLLQCRSCCCCCILISLLITLFFLGGVESAGERANLAGFCCCLASIRIRFASIVFVLFAVNTFGKLRHPHTNTPPCCLPALLWLLF